MGFSDFLVTLDELCRLLRRDLATPSRRGTVPDRVRRALAMIDGYVPQDGGEKILIEIAREDLMEILRQAGG